MVYTPVSVPACCGKSRLTIPGNNTPIMPMLAPAIRLPRNTPTAPKVLRTTRPSARVTRMPRITRSLPKRRASTGAKGANRPRQSTGKVVSKPACEAFSPKPSDTWPSTGAMLDNAGRRFKATSTRPSSNSQGRRNTTACCWTCSSSASASISSSSRSRSFDGVLRVMDSAMAFSVSGFNEGTAQALGPFSVTLLDGVEDLPMQVERGLAARKGGHIVLQSGSHDPGEVTVQLT
ncbi:hypothetical protein D3C79_573720 [compost metagenome]